MNRFLRVKLGGQLGEKRDGVTRPFMSSNMHKQHPDLASMV